jgi:hypothetical protein
MVITTIIMKVIPWPARTNPRVGPCGVSRIHKSGETTLMIDVTQPGPALLEWTQAPLYHVYGEWEIGSPGWESRIQTHDCLGHISMSSAITASISRYGSASDPWPRETQYEAWVPRPAEDAMWRPDTDHMPADGTGSRNPRSWGLTRGKIQNTIVETCCGYVATHSHSHSWSRYSQLP